MIKIAKLSTVVKEWINKNELDVVAVRFWSAIEKCYGAAPCTVMSMLSEPLIPAACEVDVMGALSMYALELASGEPSDLMGWNNNDKKAKDKPLCYIAVTFQPVFTRP